MKKIALILLAVAALSAAVVVSCKKDAVENTPEAVVSAYYGFMIQHDLDQAFQYLATDPENRQTLINTWKNAESIAWPAEYKVLSTTFDYSGETPSAQVKVWLKYDDETEKDDKVHKLVMYEGAWRIDITTK